MFRGGRIAVAMLVAAMLAGPGVGAASAPGRRVASPASAALASRLAPGDWLEEINRYRAATGLAPVTDQPSWDLGLEHHLTYLEKTPAQYKTGQYASAHTENPASPYYTADGAREAGSSDLDLGGASTPLQAVDGWLAAPFHAIGMLRPGLAQVALADDPQTGFAGLDVISGLNPDVPAATSPVLFPGPGITTNLTSFAGENPDPTETCGWRQLTVGLPLIVLLPQPPPAAGELSAELTGPGQPESTAEATLCVVDASTYRSSDAIYGPTGRSILQDDHAVLLIPRHPLITGSYHAAVHQLGQADIAWSFKVAAPHAGPGRSGPAVRLRVPAQARAHRAFAVTVDCLRACTIRLSVANRRGSVLYGFAGPLKAGIWSFNVRVPAAQSARARRLTVTLRYSRPGHGTIRGHVTYS